MPLSAYPVADGTALGLICSSRAPERWKDACKPEHMMVLRGKEGTSCYIVMSVEGHASEELFCRIIPGKVADRLFPQLQSELEADPASAHQVYAWRSTDCSGAPQLNPIVNGFEALPLADELTSCRVDPPRVPRAFGSKTKSDDPCVEPCDEAMNLPRPIKFLKCIQVTDDSYEVIRRPGLLTVVGFDSKTDEANSVEV